MKRKESVKYDLRLFEGLHLSSYRSAKKIYSIIVISFFLLLALFISFTYNSVLAIEDSALKNEVNNFHNSLIFDKNGIPFYNYTNAGHPSIGLQENLHAISTLALEFYKQYNENSNETARTYFINNVNRLVNTELLKNNSNYATYQFFFNTKHGNYTLEPPWRSAMSNGEALRPLLVAYKLTDNKTYYDTAKRLLNAFYIDIKDGGITYKSPNSGWWYEEYISKNQTKQPRVLNGMIHALLGINEFYKQTNDSTAKYLFDQGILALKNELPKYDDNGSSFYDRLGMKANPFYSSLHVVQLNQLYLLTREPIFDIMHDRWNEYNLAN